MKTILLIGGNSFIGSKFILKHQNKYNFIIISRVKTNFKNELIINDFFKIKDSLFYEADVLINFAAIVHMTENIKREVYKKINLTEMVAKSKEEYIKITNKLLNNKKYYNDIVEKIKKYNSSLFMEQESINTWFNFIIEKCEEKQS